MRFKETDPLHKRGERVNVFWPGGPYDFIVQYEYHSPVRAPGWEGWIVLHCVVCEHAHGDTVEPAPIGHRQFTSFYVHPVERGYALLPMKK